MATKTINCSISRNSQYYKVYIQYTYTQNISKNQTTVNASLILEQLTDSFDFNTSPATPTVGFKMAGTSYTKTAVINIDDKGDAGYKIVLANSGDVVFTHNSSGNKSITFSCSFDDSSINYSGLDFTYGPGRISLASTTVKLPTIPRAATVNKITNTSGTTVTESTAGSSIRVYYTPTSTSYYHRLKFYTGTTLRKTVDIGKKSSTSQTYYTLSSIEPSWFSSVTSGTLKCELKTYSDSSYVTEIGSSSKSITVKVSSSSDYKPTVTLSAQATYGHNLGNFYIAGKSSISLTATGTTNGGATLKSITISSPSATYKGTSSPYTKSFNIESSGDIEFTSKITDSRDRTGSDSYTINALSYSSPRLSSASVIRCTSSGAAHVSGEYVKGSVKGTITSLNSKNTQSLQLQYREIGTTTWSVAGSVAAATVTTKTYSVRSTNTFSTDKMWEFRFVITDAFTSIGSSILKISKDARPLNIARYNNGVAIGKLSSVTSESGTGLFEVDWPMEITTSATTQSSAGFHISNSAEKYFTITRTGMTVDADGDGTNDTNANIRGQVYVSDSGYVTLRRRYSKDSGATYTTAGYLQLRKNDAYISETLTVNGNITFKNGDNVAALEVSATDTGKKIAYVMVEQDVSGGARAGIAVCNESVYVPSASNSGKIDLGISNRKWNNIYATNATIQTSDRNCKTNIYEMSGKQEELFNKLNPVTYQFKDGTSRRTHYGFISQDVESALYEINMTGADFAGFCKDLQRDDNGNIILDDNGNEMYDYSLRYSEFIALNTHMIQKLKAENDDLKARISALEEKINQLI